MDMKGKHVAITGPTAGIGKASALELARRGAQLTLLCRNPAKGEQLRDEVVAAGGLAPQVILMDMSELDSVRKAAAQCLALGQPLDVLLNNAGVVNLKRKETVDGFEETLAVNHFAPFLLTGLLLPQLLQAPAPRIVNVASAAHEFVRSMGFDDMQSERKYSVFTVYGRSKLANILFTRTLSQRLADKPITVNCLHPGAVATSLGRQNPGVLGKILPLFLKPFFLSPEQGAATSLYLCCSDEVAQVSGEYFARSALKQARPWARDDAAAEELWAYTEKALDFSFFGPEDSR
jgi:NAD(P)-dependent dehydrogenase (short-subunit alcohol dehydrogenase family)